MVRTIAMDGTAGGLVRGQRVLNTGSPITVPVGRATLGRIINVIGEPIDEKGDITSGYESEDSSVNEVDMNASADEEEEGTKRGGGGIKDSEFITEHVDGSDKGIASTEEDPIQAELANCILKCKAVFKCRLCPRIVCLSEDTVKAHLSSKRHARSKKLLGEGRLKLMLNSDGEIEEDQETHAERHSRIVALAQETTTPAKKDSGRQRQNLRRKKRLRNGSNKGKSEATTKSPKKKTRKD